jgi:hypothetical protein
MHFRCTHVAAFLGFLTFLACAPASPEALAAAAPEDKCEAKKLTVTGVYASCRLKAEARAQLQGKAPDYTACEESFAKNFAKAEEKAGPGVCPSEGDHAEVSDTVAECTAELSTALAAADGCPPAYQSRTTYQVVQDLLAAIAAEDWDAAGCNYAETAFLIDDQGILLGRQEIVSALVSLFVYFEDVPIDVHDGIYHDDVGRVLFSLDGGWIHIEDGVFTYVIKNGKIRHQTTHGLITFSGPPPE